MRQKRVLCENLATGLHKKVYPSSRLSIQTLLTSQNITRATRQDYVTCQVLAETDKASKGHYPHLYYQFAIELVIP